MNDGVSGERRLRFFMLFNDMAMTICYMGNQVLKKGGERIWPDIHAGVY